MLNREGILKADDLKVEQVSVPEWGGNLYVRAITGAERDAFEGSCIAEGGGTNMTNLRARLCVLAICDKDGVCLFTDEDATVLGAKSARAINRVFTAAQKLSGLTKADVDELEQSLTAGQGDASASA